MASQLLDVTVSEVPIRDRPLQGVKPVEMDDLLQAERHCQDEAKRIRVEYPPVSRTIGKSDSGGRP